MLFFTFLEIIPKINTSWARPDSGQWLLEVPNSAVLELFGRFQNLLSRESPRRCPPKSLVEARVYPPFFGFRPVAPEPTRRCASFWHQLIRIYVEVTWATLQAK